MAEYKKFQELALYQAIEDLTLWFVPHIVWPTHRRSLRANLVRGRRRLRGQLRAVSAGEMEGAAAVDSLRSWFAHLAQADTYRLRIALWATARPVLAEYV